VVAERVEGLGRGEFSGFSPAQVLFIIICPTQQRLWPSKTKLL